MYFNTLTTYLAIGAFAVQAMALPQVSPNNLAERALGINCNGSGLCRKGSMAAIQNAINNIDNNRQYSNGYHIACDKYSNGSGTCAFLQNCDHQVTGGVIKELIQGLVNHNCQGCGSNPVYNYGASPSNDPQWGILTVNYVANSDNPCSGLC